MTDPVPNPEAYPPLRRTFERWQQRHPALARAPGWPIWLAALAVLAFAALVVLPFALPLGGPETLDPAALADDNGLFVTVEGETLYAVHAAADGPAIVLVHGFGGSTVTWTETLPVLAAAGYDAYAIDLRGFGLSDKGFNADYHPPAQARRVLAWMDAAGLERAALVGHSMGGNVAAYAALAAPERVSALVLVDAAILSQERAWGLPGTLIDGLLDAPFLRRWAQIALRRAAPDLFADLLRDATYNDAVLTPDLISSYERALRTPEWELALLGMLRDADGDTAPVGQLRIPTLILWGVEDRWVLPSEGVRLETLIPGAERVEIAGAGHLPMHEAPEAFQAALLGFLERVIS